MDNEETFRQSLQRQPATWIYRNKKIIYKNNELGFRTRSFSEVDWSESIVIFGCSNVYGEGLAEEDTISSNLEKMLGFPVINLGIDGSGIDLACWNSLILHESNNLPKALVHIWSSLDRYSDKIENNIFSFIPSRPGYDPKLNWAERSKFYVSTDRALWRDKTLYCEATFFPHTAIELKLNSPTKSEVHQLKHLDNARDNAHPGIASAKFAAGVIAADLKNRGIK